MGSITTATSRQPAVQQCRLDGRSSWRPWAGVRRAVRGRVERYLVTFFGVFPRSRRGSPGAGAGRTRPREVVRRTAPVLLLVVGFAAERVRVVPRAVGFDGSFLHRGYRRTSADVLLTNRFQLNPLALRGHGLADRLDDLGALLALLGGVGVVLKHQEGQLDPANGDEPAGAVQEDRVAARVSGQRRQRPLAGCPCTRAPPVIIITQPLGFSQTAPEKALPIFGQTLTTPPYKFSPLSGVKPLPTPPLHATRPKNDSKLRFAGQPLPTSGNADVNERNRKNNGTPRQNTACGFFTTLAFTLKEARRLDGDHEPRAQADRQRPLRRQAEARLRRRIDVVGRVHLAVVTEGVVGEGGQERQHDVDGLDHSRRAVVAGDGAANRRPGPI